MANRSKVIKCANYEWDSVSRKDYKDDSSCYKGVHRYSLLGEKQDEEALNFQTRYFEVEPGGYTSFEYHEHPHSVVVIRGAGTVILENELHQLSLHDVVYIAPNSLHQFHADCGEPLGFICTVDRERDRPSLPDQDTINDRIQSGKVRKKIKV
ncbi:cupin domain-containing protein [Fodinibius halophilus]|uniref:Cupin domain-containing protein n=1 Tax=Fodinibius halophilus TaxID=1736908 RepID=A0A6M1T4L7_9BACT|nr:cupin domain-containing protein [Fodinibius halophilus]NGP87613.1 cupin domain-containing protein [Fodinibius halophilus]